VLALLSGMFLQAASLVGGCYRANSFVMALVFNRVKPSGLNTGRLLVSGTKTRQMHAGSLPAQSPSRGSGDRRAVHDYKNVRNTKLQ
jgi:hypothetical protein